MDWKPFANQLRSRWREYRSLGARGERFAAGLLRRAGMKIVARRVRLHQGEIDIVALDRGTLVFVEVKTRQSDLCGAPHEAVDFRKQKKLTLLASVYCKKYRIENMPIRFDIVGIVWPTGKRRPQTVNHYRSAFEAKGPWG